MKILITAGKTAEKIDEIRALTNLATGQLGKIIAETLLQNQEVEIVYFVTSEKNMVPKDVRVQPIFITSTNDLAVTIQKLLQSEKIDVVIHAMAVSDFRVAKTTSLELLAHHLAHNQVNFSLDVAKNLVILKKLVNTLPSYDPQQKLDSEIENPCLILEKTMKIARFIKIWDPQIFYVGFKLVVNVPSEKMFQKAWENSWVNHCDLMVVNDWSQIDDQKHHAWILENHHEPQFCPTKTAIAEKLVRRIFQKLKMEAR